MPRLATRRRPAPAGWRLTAAPLLGERPLAAPLLAHRGPGARRRALDGDALRIDAARPPEEIGEGGDRLARSKRMRASRRQRLRDRAARRDLVLIAAAAARSGGGGGAAACPAGRRAAAAGRGRRATARSGGARPGAGTGFETARST